jgi:hypothetical protein
MVYEKKYDATGRDTGVISTEEPNIEVIGLGCSGISNSHIRKFRVDFEYLHYGLTFDLKFTATLADTKQNESWGLRNLVIFNNEIA